MARDLLARYIWMVDTIRRFGHISRQEFNERWKRTSFSGGEPMPRRTFYNYRQAVEEIFRINIKCDQRTFEYYIEEEDDHNRNVTNWLLNSQALSSVLSDSRDVSERIFIENVPSAREFLGIFIEGLREYFPVRFDYHPYTRTNPSRDVVVEPYFLKIFRQRWYITGRNVADGTVKTYALDRMSNVLLRPEHFRPDPSFDPETYFRDSFGIVFSQGDVKDVVLKVDHRQAKYFRALPLHHSQQEMIHDEFSIFTYKLRLTPDFLQELLSYGPAVTVLQPAELRAMVVDSLRQSLAHYEN